MIFSVDSFIFIGFLIANVVFGLTSSHGVKNIREYAVGNRNFSTATLVATIVATWVSGEFFYSNIFETYSKGLYAMWIALGDPIYLLTTENYPKIHTAPPDAEIIFSIVSLEGLYSSKNRSTLYLDNNALIPCRM